MTNKIKLTDELQEQITKDIREGAFPHVAAEANGVSKQQFDLWIEYGGKKAHKYKHYKVFAAQVRQAEAQARMKAETSLYKNDPKQWLMGGPGRDKKDDPGWSARVRAQGDREQRSIELFASPEFLRFMGMLREALAPYPEAMAALSDAIQGKKPEPKPAAIPIEFTVTEVKEQSVSQAS